MLSTLFKDAIKNDVHSNAYRMILTTCVNTTEAGHLCAPDGQG